VEDIDISINGTFSVSEVTPMPAADDASFTLNTSEAGPLNVTIYDLTGAIVQEAIIDRYINENTEITIPLNFSNLSSGTYTIEISVNTDRALRSVIIKK
jgi:hypothetical protein